MPKRWFLYVLLCSDDTYYTGIATNLERRLKEHNTSTRGAKYTKARRPVKLIYFEDYPDRSSAQKAECRFKKMSRKQKEIIINEVGRPSKT